MSAHQGGTATSTGQPEPAQHVLDVSDPKLSRFEVVREGARRDGVEIVHYEPQFPVPGTKAERRLERTVAALFLFAGASAAAFLVIYVAWPWEYEPGPSASSYYTPLLGLTMGLSLLAVGFAVLVWGKKLLPHEISIQDRHDGPSPAEDRVIAGQTIAYMGDELGLSRRPLLKGAVALGLAPVGVLAVAPLIGGLIRDPHDGEPLIRTGWHPDNNEGQPVRLSREDGSAVRPEDVSVGGMVTVFPGIPHGASNQYADSPTLLFHLRDADAREAEQNSVGRHNEGANWGNFFAYSKICTHAGCPASLYEQRTNRLLCPCHQSQFLITDNARPVFGPAARSLPQLPIGLDDEGFLVARSDYPVAVGPSFWERP